MLGKLVDFSLKWEDGVHLVHLEKWCCTVCIVGGLEVSESILVGGLKINGLVHLYMEM